MNLGHALGLKHGHEADSAVGATNETVLTEDRDYERIFGHDLQEHIGEE